VVALEVAVDPLRVLLLVLLFPGAVLDLLAVDVRTATGGGEGVGSERSSLNAPDIVDGDIDFLLFIFPLSSNCPRM
jgi:hypothetical protein